MYAKYTARVVSPMKQVMEQIDLTIHYQKSGSPENIL